MAKHGSTLGGSPFVCRLGCEFLDIMRDEDVLDNVRRVGVHLGTRLEALAEQFAEITDVRGVGLMWGVQLTVPARPLAEAGLRRGVLFNTVQGNVLRFLPPLILSVAQVDEALDVLEQLMHEMLTPVAAALPVVTMQAVTRQAELHAEEPVASAA